jgi:hypothetical protein
MTELCTPHYIVGAPTHKYNPILFIFNVQVTPQKFSTVLIKNEVDLWLKRVVVEHWSKEK